MSQPPPPALTLTYESESSLKSCDATRDPGQLLHLAELIRLREEVVGPGQPVHRHATCTDLGRARRAAGPAECAPPRTDPAAETAPAFSNPGESSAVRGAPSAICLLCRHLPASTAVSCRLRGPRRTYHDADNVSSNRNGQTRIGVDRRRTGRPGEHLPLPLGAARTSSEIAALAEPSQTVREALARPLRASPARTPTGARSSTAAALDAVLIASPAGTHLEIVLAALDAGLHVFCEKPICLTRRRHRPGRSPHATARGRSSRSAT